MAVLPVYSMITLPGTNIYYQSETYTKMTGRTPREGDRVTIVVCRKEMTKAELASDSFYPIGVTGSITEVNANGYFVMHLASRINIEEAVVFPDYSVDLTVSRRPETDDLDREQVQPRLKKIKNEIIRFAEAHEWGQMIRAYASRWNTIEEIAAAMSPWMVASNEEKYAALACDSASERFDKLEKMIFENLEISKVQAQAQGAQEQDYQKIYRENAIKKQMEYLQKELDDMHPENVSDIRRLEIALQESPMNEDARKEGERILNRLKSEGRESAETGMLMDYLELLTGLPWEKEEPQKISLDEARKILDADHAGMKKVKKRIIEQMAVLTLKGAQTGSILLFVGAPGTGKTSIGKSIADALGRKYVRVSLGGVRDEADIRGHRRTYIGSMPGRIIDGIKKCGTSNPVMVLDEVDKLSQSYNGDPASALLEVLDPEQNHTFTDHYLNVPYDLSDVLFICTANTTETIPEPLLNRMEVIQFQGYTPMEKAEIARKHLLPKAMETVGIREDQLEVTDEAIDRVISEFTRESGVRGLRKRMDTICRAAAVQLVENDGEKVLVNAANVAEILDSNPIHQKRVKEKTVPGVVTGLAWTSVGGDILYIESMLTKGDGKIQVTGQLGDVMKESAQIAMSLVKSLYPEKAKKFREHDLHIHVPDGATPKDGPSAGITLTTALASLITGKKVSPKIAMTGEVSLQGQVNPIGGLPEKLLAAQRAGVQKVFIPKDNVDDLKDVAPEVKAALTIEPVERVSDVLSSVLK